MKGKLFLSQFNPNLLIISGEFLSLLGYDMEELAVESIKYNTILSEYLFHDLGFFQQEIIHKW